MENKTISVDYSINEAQVLLEIIDIAVRTRGIAAAEAGLVLTRKIESKLKLILPPQAQPVPPDALQDNSFAAHIIKP